MKTLPIATFLDAGLLKTDAPIGCERVPGAVLFGVDDPAAGPMPAVRL